MDNSNTLEKVIKSNALIEACHKLSTQEQKILLLAISKIPKNALPTDELLYSITANDLAQLNGQELKHCYAELKANAFSLMDKRVHIKDLPNGDGKRNKVLVTCWVQSVFYIDHDGKIEIRFSKDILPYICQLKNQFTIYKIKNIGMMSSSYGIRLYELLMQHLSFGKRDLSIEWIKDNFQISKKYPAIKDFKKWVLEPALRDINEKSDLWVNFSQKKTGRKVTHICFVFGLKEDQKTKNQKDILSKSSLINEDFLSKNALPGESRKAALKRLGANVFSN